MKNKITIQSCIEDLCTLVRIKLDSPDTTFSQREKLKLIQRFLIKIQNIYITYDKTY